MTRTMILNFLRLLAMLVLLSMIGTAKAQAQVSRPVTCTQVCSPQLNTCWTSCQ